MQVCVDSLLSWYSGVVVYLQGQADAESLLGERSLEMGEKHKSHPSVGSLTLSLYS